MCIVCFNGEPLSVVIEHQISAQANFISIETPIMTGSDASGNDSDTQEYAFQVQQRVNSIKHKGREILEGVYPPLLKEKERRKYRQVAAKKLVPVEIC